MSVFAKPAPAVSEQDIRTFADDGFVVIRGLVPLDLIADIRAHLATVVDQAISRWHAAGEIADLGTHLPFETRLSTVAPAQAGSLGRGWRKTVACPALHRLHHAPALVEAAARLLGPEVDAHQVWNARPKLPGQQLTTVPWHQDSAYFGPETVSSRILTVWIPLVPVDARNGTLQLARGSHRSGLLSHVIEQRTGQFLEIEGSEPAADVLVTPTLIPGDVIILDNLCWHRSLDNQSDGIRWSIDIRYLRSGDHPGHYRFPGDWVVRSAQRPTTDLATWTKWAEELPW